MNLKSLSITLISLAFLTGCQGNGVKSFWDTHSICMEDIDEEQDQFASFAELAAAAPEDVAFAEMDALFDLLKKDEVYYYVYSEWMNGAFYNIYSPCRNAALYNKAVERIVADGILSPSEYEFFIKKGEWIRYNLEGHQATVPGVSLHGERTLVLVLDQGCPSCREALTSMAENKQWAACRKVAVCCGHGPIPTVPGWEYAAPDNARAVFDPRMTPVYFVVSEDGTVETTYTLAI